MCGFEGSCRARGAANLPQRGRGFKNAKTLAVLLKAPSLQSRLAPEGSRSQHPFWRHKSAPETQKLRYSLGVHRILATVGVEYGVH